MGGKSDLGRSHLAAIALAGLVALALMAVPVAGPLLLAPDLAHLATRMALTAAALFATYSAGAASVRSTGSLRWGWALLAVTAVLWSLSNLVAARAELLEGGTLPVPSPADVPAAIALVFGVLAILTLLSSVLPSAARMRALLDGLLIAGSLCFVAWELVLRDLYASSGAGPERVLALAYPLGDVLLVALLLVSLTRLKLTRRWVLLLSAFGLHSVSHAVFAYLEVANVDEPGLESLVWIAGTLCAAAAALPGESTFRRRPAPPRAGTLADILVPCIPLAMCLALAARQAAQGPLGTFLLMNAGIVIVVLVARQLLAQVEYLTLYRQLEASVTHGVDVLTVVGPDGRIRQQTGPSERVLGCSGPELIGTLFGDLVHPSGRDEVLKLVTQAPEPPVAPVSLQLMLRHGDGDWTLTDTKVSDLNRHPDVRGFLLTSRDAGRRRSLGNQLSPEALTDALTGLGNRVLFLDCVREAVERNALSPEVITVVLIDIDGFSELNDALGHAAGDLLLIEVATRLKTSLRKGDTLARLSADEFGILLTRDQHDVPLKMARRVLSRLTEPFTLHGRPFPISASAGVATGDEAPPTPEDLLRCADLALGQAKAAGRGAISVFEKDMHSAARRRVQTESDLQRALDNNEFELHFQPIVDLPSGRIAGAEALLRWNRGGEGAVAPAELLAIAEESALAIRLGRWVLHEACRQACRFQEAHHTYPPIFVSVNLSGRQLMQPSLPGEIQHALRSTGLPASSLVLEILESSLIDEGPELTRTIENLKRVGVLLAIDDFGTGWSSLSRLRSFPVDKIKIDRPFIADVHDAEEEAPLLAAIVAMAHSLNVVTVAEGVETVEQLAVLWRHGCESAQGYGLYRPVPADELAQLLGGHALMLEAIPLRPLSADAQSYLDDISAVAQGTAPLDEVTPPLLSQLLRIIDADAAYLTQDDADRGAETIRCLVLRDGAGVVAREGQSLAFQGSPTEAGRVNGPRVEQDLREKFGHHDVVTAVGAVSHLAVPVETPDGRVFGTLCISSARPDAIPPDVVRLVELLARLLGNHPEAKAAPDGKPVAAV